MQKDQTKVWTEINLSQTQGVEVEQNKLLPLICLPCNAASVSLVSVPSDYDLTLEFSNHISIAGKTPHLSFF